MKKGNRIQPDPTENLRVEKSNEGEFIVYGTISAVLVLILAGLYAILLTDWRPREQEARLILFISVLWISAPLLTVGFLKTRQLFWNDRHRRKTIVWTVDRIEDDINNRLGVEFTRDDTWFLDACKYWFEKGEGSTTYKNSQRVLGLNLVQWRAAKDALINAGIAEPVSRQGGNEGFRIRARDWNSVVGKLPATPRVEQLNAYNPAFARDARYW